MTPPSPPAWIPGLPSEPCVCDVLHDGVLYRNADVCKMLGGTVAVVCRPGTRIRRLLTAHGSEWRPIEVPRGV